MNNYTVYRHTTPNGKRYIGITSKSVLERWKDGFGYYNNKHFYNAILKYGWNNIKHEIVANNMQREWAIELEKQLILYYHSNEYKYGYNQAVGGLNNRSGYHFNHTEQTKRLLSELRKGVKLSEQHRQGIKRGWIARKERGRGNAWNKGLSLKNTGMLDNFIATGKINAEKMRKSVAQIDLSTGEIINTFNSILEAAHSMNRNYVSSIVDVLKGRRKSAFGFGWNYVNGVSRNKNLQE